LARLAVIAILPDLKAADAPLLKDRHRACLHRALRGSNSELILATLQALEHVGDHKAIPSVRRLIPCPVWLVYSDRIEQAARQCLLALRARNEKQRTRHTLLRAATDVATSTEILLRPAQDTGTADRQQLLRAGRLYTTSSEEPAAGITGLRPYP